MTIPQPLLARFRPSKVIHRGLSELFRAVLAKFYGFPWTYTGFWPGGGMSTRGVKKNEKIKSLQWGRGGSSIGPWTKFDPNGMTLKTILAQK